MMTCFKEKTTRMKNEQVLTSMGAHKPRGGYKRMRNSKYPPVQAARTSHS